jgi:hypothetical protein
MRRICMVLFPLITAIVHAQDVTGIWRGHFQSNSVFQRLTAEDDRYKMEVQIAQQRGDFRAVTYSYKSTVFYGKAVADGTINFKTQKVLLREKQIEELRMSYGDACIMTCFLKYSKLGDEEFLEGTYTSMNTRDSSDCGKGTLFLHKVATTDFYVEPFLLKKEKAMEEEKKSSPAIIPPAAELKKVPSTATKKGTSTSVASSKKTTPSKSIAPVATSKTAGHSATKTALALSSTPKKVIASSPKPPPLKKDMVKIDPSKTALESIDKDSVTSIHEKSVPPVPIPSVLSARSNELVKTITVNTREVELNIYDDGAIDNDTVSVYFDNKLIVSRAMLTDRAIVVKLHLDESQETHRVVMVADNLGDIPPNTSLMVVKAGEKQYEVRIVSDEQKNAVVVFKYQKPL